MRHASAPQAGALFFFFFSNVVFIKLPLHIAFRNARFSSRCLSWPACPFLKFVVLRCLSLLHVVYALIVGALVNFRQLVNVICVLAVLYHLY